MEKLCFLSFWAFNYILLSYFASYEASSRQYTWSALNTAAKIGVSIAHQQWWAIQEFCFINN